MLFWSNPIVTSDVYQLLFPVVPDVTFKLQDGAVLSTFISISHLPSPAPFFTYPYIVFFPSVSTLYSSKLLYVILLSSVNPYSVTPSLFDSNSINTFEVYQPFSPLFPDFTFNLQVGGADTPISIVSETNSRFLYLSFVGLYIALTFPLEKIFLSHLLFVQPSTSLQFSPSSLSSNLLNLYSGRFEEKFSFIVELIFPSSSFIVAIKTTLTSLSSFLFSILYETL